MLVPDPSSLMATSISPQPMPEPVGLFAYGPAPGMELIPYFLALLTWVGMAVLAIFLSPITALVRRLRRARGAPATEHKNETVTPPVQESRGDDNNVQA